MRGALEAVAKPSPQEAPEPTRTPETEQPLSGSKQMLQMQQPRAPAPSPPGMGPCLHPQARTSGAPCRGKELQKSM